MHDLTRKKRILGDYTYCQETIKNLRKSGENDNRICELIREDSIDEFIQYINQNCISLNSCISPSFYETNNFLQEKNKEVSLIEYAAFHGSIRIFQYLSKEVPLDPSLWMFSIHSNNDEIIAILEENQVEADFQEIYNESIKCHHINIMRYLHDNYYKKVANFNPYESSLKYNNFINLFDLIEKVNDVTEIYSIYEKPKLVFDFLKYNCFSISKYFISNDINFDIDYKFENSMNLLHMAVLRNNEEIVQLLMNKQNIHCNAYCNITESNKYKIS